MSRSIISGNVNSDLDLVGGATNSFQSNGYNLVGATATATAEFVETGDIINSSPMLEGLANNGGPTMTHLLMSGSPALNSGGSATAGSGEVPMFDQRGIGFDRVLGSQIDIGAVEMPAPVGPALPGDYNLDGGVDAADYVMWRKMFGLTVPQYEGADGNGDTMIDDGDHAVWTEHFGEPSPGSGGEAAADSQSAALAAFPFNVYRQASSPFNGRSALDIRTSTTALQLSLLNVLDTTIESADGATADSESVLASDSESGSRDAAFDELFDADLEVVSPSALDV
jgi:hypothetical protein